MLPADSLIQFFAASLLLAAAPGPDNIFVLTQSALYGPRAGLATTFGLMTGLIVHTTAVALGLALLIQSSPTAFLLLKLAGAAYLLYLAWLSFKSGSTLVPTQTGEKYPGGEQTDTATAQPAIRDAAAPAATAQAVRSKVQTAAQARTTATPGAAALYRRGAIMNATNPKVTLFFLAFLPQFIQPGSGAVTAQIFLLGGLVMLSTLLVFSMVSLAGGRLAPLFNASPRGQRIAGLLAGCVFAGLAFALVFTG